MRVKLEERFTLYTASQVARALGISKRTLDRMIKDGRIPAPAKSANGYRFWTPPEMEQLERQAKELTH
ncbi:MAG: MerR family DNA-binding transcriptional regulator [Bryobacterales bacterium]|nr:MerR family DNA-binding transcriptional regulator [Bryobacterales bacterium]